MMLGTSDHNIEAGGCGGKQGISVVSCGWLFFWRTRYDHYIYIYAFYYFDALHECTDILIININVSRNVIINVSINIIIKIFFLVLLECMIFL